MISRLFKVALLFGSMARRTRVVDLLMFSQVLSDDTASLSDEKVDVVSMMGRVRFL